MGIYAKPKDPSFLKLSARSKYFVIQIYLIEIAKIMPMLPKEIDHNYCYLKFHINIVCPGH